MTLRENATSDFDAEIDGDASLVPEYNNDEELFYVSVNNAARSDEELIDLMNRVLDSHDDVMQTITVALPVDIEEMGVEGEYDTVLRVGHTLS